MPACAGVRRFGAASLDLAYVAAGRYDGYWERELKPWDIAAGLLIVQEAGGFVDGLRAGRRSAGGRGADPAANDEIFDRFAGLIRSREA